MISLIAALLLALDATPPAASPDRFHGFMDSLVGEWAVTIREHLPDGKLMFELHQTRRVSPVLDGGFLQETAFDSDNAAAAPGGMMFLSYDRARDVVLQQAFLSGHPGLRFTAEAKLADDGHSAIGTIVTPREPGFRTNRELRLYWAGPDEFHYEAWAHDGAGPEFLNEELVYRRKR